MYQVLFPMHKKISALMVVAEKDKLKLRKINR